MASVHSPYIIGLSAGCDQNCDRFKRLASKGFDIIECGPIELANVRSVIEKLSKKKSGYSIAINLKADSSSLSEDAILKNIEKKFSLIYDFADIFVVDINNQNEDYSNDILDILTKTRISYEDDKTILFRISKSLDKETTDKILSNCRLYGIDGIITENWKELDLNVMERFPVYAEISDNATIETVSSAFKKGVSAILLKNVKPKRSLAKAIHNIQIENQ